MKRRLCPAPNEGLGTGKAAKGTASHREAGTFCHLAIWSTGIRCDGLRVTLCALVALFVTAAALGRAAPQEGGNIMPTHITVSRVRTVEHLDATSGTHATDRERAREARQRKAAQKETRNKTRPNEALLYPSLGGGLLFGPDGRELSPSEHKARLVEAIAERSFYWRDEVRADGRLRRRKRKTNGAHNLAVTVRPDFAMLLAALERNPNTRHLVRPFMLQLARELAREFAALTGLEVLAVEVHPEEGNLHLHLSYATVSADNRLLWSDRSAGRKGLRCAGAWHIGNLRLALAGYVPRDDAALAVADLRRVQSLHGAPPIDWTLSQSVDGHCVAFVEKHGLQAAFADVAERYGREVRERRAQRPDQLRAQAAKATADRDRLAKENAALKAQLAALTQGISAPLPPLPSLSLSTHGRDRGRTR